MARLTVFMLSILKLYKLIMNLTYLICIAFQIIIDNRRHIRHVRSGFLGHLNDSGQFLLLPPSDQANYWTFHLTVLSWQIKGMQTDTPLSWLSGTFCAVSTTRHSQHMVKHKIFTMHNFQF